MGAGVLHVHRQLAAAAIQIQGTGLEDAALATVKAGKRDKVIQKQEQVALKEYEFFKVFSLFLATGFRAILLHQGKQALLIATGQQGVRFVHGHGGHRCAGLGGQPGLAGGQGGAQLLPLGPAQLRLRPQQGRDHLGLKDGHGIHPRGIEALGQRQQRIRMDGRQGQCSNGTIAGVQSFFPQQGIAFCAGT